MVVKHSPTVPKGPKEEKDEKKKKSEKKEKKEKKEKEKKQESATAKKAKKEKKKKEEKLKEEKENDPDPGEGFSGSNVQKLLGNDEKNSEESQSLSESSGEDTSSEESSSDAPDSQSSSESEDEPEDADEDLSRLIYKRGQVKAKITRIRSTLRTSRNQMNLPRVQVLQKNLQTYYTEYTNYHSEILDSVDKQGRKAHESKYQIFEELYTETLVTLQSLELQLTTPTPPAQPQHVPGGTERVVIHQQALKAPLPTFDGSYENWPKFKSMFLDLMKHSQDSDAIKLYHLDRALVGEAAGIIDIQTINDNNYARAWELLEEEFDNKRNIIDKHIRGLTMMTPMTKECYKQLRKLLDECTRHVGHLEFLGQKLEGVSELMVINFLSDALDDDTKKLWEATLEKGELPKYKDTIEFLKKRCQILERCRSSTTKTESSQKAKSSVKAAPTKTVTKSHAATSQSSEGGYACHLCNNTHATFRCEEFRALSLEEREKRARDVNACFNCLRKGHRKGDCRSTKNCTICKARHNTLLHPNTPTKNSGDTSKGKQQRPERVSDTSNESQQRTAAPPPATPPNSTESVNCSCSMQQAPNQVLLMTAVVNVFDKYQKVHQCRAFIDPGSMSHMVSKRLADKLDLPTTPAFITVSGINGIKSTANKRMDIEFQSRTTEFRARINCLVLERVTGRLPLTDIDFNVPDEIDLLIGCGLFWQLLVPGSLSVGDNLPELRNSKLGWIVSGEYSANLEAEAEAVVVHSNAAIVSPLEQLVQKFWELEAVPESSTLTSDEEYCEQHYQKTHSRDESGRYIVALPFNDALNELGESRALAVKRFFMLEKRLSRYPELKQQYVAFMDEYQALQHCKEVDESTDPPGLQTYYLPHHAVLRPSSSTTKLRVVFDASAKSSSGKSLNDVLHVGAVVQSDLFSIALRFRKHSIAFTADLTKMYRQVRVKDDDSRYQRILWRRSPSEPLKVYELTTVTYGTAAAPFLATRTLKQLASDERDQFPEVADVVENDFYVDDVLSGAATVEEAIRRQQQLKELLALGGFPIHKWSSNSPEVTQNVPESEREKPLEINSVSANEVIKTLGLLWDPVADQFLFLVPEIDDVADDKITKRYVLSQVARLFDPYGFLSPILVVAKLIIQRAWGKQLGWDDQLPKELLSSWKAYREALPYISELRIPRCVVPPATSSFELHGYADASNVAYGAGIYVRCIKEDGSDQQGLLCSKSKVAPLQELSIPRKELCAFLLLCRLLLKTVSAMKLKIDRIVLYSDSQIVLAWLKKLPSLLQIFVRNRVAEINEIMKLLGAVMQYIHTSKNPADIISRGQLAPDLRCNDVFWHGPPDRDEPEHPEAELSDDEIPELRNMICAAPVIEEMLPVFTKYGSFRKLQRVIGLVLRFAKNAKQQDPAQRSTSVYVTIPEMRAAMSTIIRVIQLSEYEEDIQRIQEGERCKNIENLSPIYENGFLRVGGRLQHSDLSYDQKHQLILPQKNSVVKLLVRAIHEENLHVGPQGLVAAIRQRFWITNTRSVARQITRGCVTCFKARPTEIEQQMGSLPRSRVTQAAPFARTGVDFAGPVFVKHGLRKPTLVKAYISVFVCMVTKAVHLELVSDLSTPAFIAALHRFVSRRGVPEQMHSDNGLNFVGAKNELHELYVMFQDQQAQGLIAEFCQPREIEWKFIPPRAAHFGGLWEANVKCVKSHLKKILKTTTLNFEEFATVLTQIEAILNSRPLFAQSNDPNDPSVITPGHFLIGRELTAIPEPSYENLNSNRLSRWKYIQSLRQHFWRRWSSEYLNQLQGRQKWRTKKPNVAKGMIVILKEDNQPAQSWKLGRIEETYPGKDGAVRVVDVRTAQGTYQRPITKICPLPIEDNEELEDRSASASPSPA